MNTYYTRKNEEITAPELRVLGEDGKNLGTMQKADALKISREKGLDLIEIAPTAKPPVARIMSFDKFRYEQGKKLRKQRAEEKGRELKQIQIGVGTAKNDLEVKSKKAEKFIKEGHPLVIVLVLRGRQKANRDWAKMKLEEFLKMLPFEYQIVMQPRWGMRGVSVQIAKK